MNSLCIRVLQLLCPSDLKFTSDTSSQVHEFPPSLFCNLNLCRA